MGESHYFEHGAIGLMALAYYGNSAITGEIGAVELDIALEYVLDRCVRVGGFKDTIKLVSKILAKKLTKEELAGLDE